MGFIKTTFALIGLAAGGYAGASSAMAASLTKTAGVRPEETPESVGLDFQDVSFTSREGDARLSGWIIPVHSPSQPASTTLPVTTRGSSWFMATTRTVATPKREL